VGAPGRLNDMAKRGPLGLDHCRVLILDEADEMLDRGFKDQIYTLFQHMPSDVQVGLFSATMGPDALELSRQFLRDPVRILCKEEELTLEGIAQFYIALDDPRQRVPCLLDLYETITVTQAMIFCNTRRSVDELYEALTAQDFTCSCIHADLDWTEREVVMREFKSGSSRILIATDLLAKGIDVQQVSLVVNYDLPQKVELYLHRIGRGGRYGRKGVAINFVTERSVRTLKDIERHYATQIEEMPADVATWL
jgi:translation initiation factor 4A